MLDFDEIRWLWRAAERLSYPVGPFVQLLILTGARRSEIAEMPWAELDFRTAQVRWTLPKERAKSKVANTIVLSPLAVDIINAMPHYGTGKPKWLFSMDGMKTYRSFGYAKSQLDAAMLAVAREEAVEAGRDPADIIIAPWTYHDCRRSFITHLINTDIAPPHVAESVVNHKVTGTASHYNYAKLEAQTSKALADWAVFIKKIIGDEKAAEIVTLPMGKALERLAHTK